ncbi:MAG: amidohydrolase family protein [Candidatus Sungbacteria bacterium]|uniref:Amidohydrolase family protein n=1 Tax=Candidatus Sungiibacteriota bacterium TaxID=2750080 RepID=A0A931SB00_9BACT|nr:amidohydrolase family protein [Candidatus Sungbacteria bacterium]
MYDLLVKNGQIIDGTGKPAFSADIAADQGTIVKIGNLSAASAQTVIDAAGHYVVPGFIDITNHSDVTAALFHTPGLDSLVRQGITTIIGGNCGVSLAPLVTADTIHAIRKWAPTSSINVNWISVSEFLKEVEKIRPAVNFGTLVGHGTLRRGVIGEEQRVLSLEELSSLKLLLKTAIREGAFGLSTNLSASHEAPATPDELIEISKVLKSEGGIYKTHLRNEGISLIASVNEALQIAHGAKVPVSISHLKAIGRKAWPLMKRALKMIERTQKSGEDVIFDVSPYASTGSQLSALLSPWVREGGFGHMIERLRDRSIRPTIVEDLAGLTLHFDRIRVAEAEDGISPGKTIADLAIRSGLSPEDTMIELLVANSGRVSIIGKTIHRKNIARAVRNATAVVATNGSGFSDVSDGYLLPHPRSFGTFPRYFYRYVNQEKILSWEEAVIKATSLPARFLGIPNRGLIAEKYAADIVVLSPDTIRDRATYENPYLFPGGIPYVIVNGAVVVSGGAMTGNRPGKVLRRK